MPDLGEVLSRKYGPLPLWGWVAVGGGGVVLFVLLTRRGAAQQTAGYGSSGYAAPSAGQLEDSQVAALQGAMSDYAAQTSDQIAAMQQANADALAGTQQQLTDWMTAQSALVQGLIAQDQDQQAALLGSLADSQAAYSAQLASSNATFLAGLHDALKAYAPNGTAPPQTGSAGDPLAGAPDWLRSRLQSSYWQTRQYVTRSDTNLGPQYSAAVDAFLRSDTASGLNVSGASAAAQQQLNALIAAGQVARNPLYPG